MKWTKAFAFAATLTWAIQGEWLERVLLIANREGAGVEAVEKELGRQLDNTQTMTVRDGVAVLPVVGPIFRRANLFTEVSGATSIDILARDFNAALADPNVKAILLNVDSPGGEITGVAEFAQMVADAKKPCVAYVGGLGCSAAYWIASAADRVVIDPTAQVGSIGVVQAMPNPDAKSAADVEIVSSQSPKKRPNVATESGRAVIQERVDALADVFVATVARYRDVTQAKVLADFGRGATLVGESAVREGMADAIGSYESTLADLARATKEQDMKTMAKALGLPETASEAEILKAIDERNGVIAALGASTPAQAIGAAHGLKQAATLAETSLERIARLEAEGRERDVAKILDDNRERFTPAIREKALRLCGAGEDGKGADPVKLRAMAEMLPKQASLGSGGHAPPAPAQQPAPTGVDATALGIEGDGAKLLKYGAPNLSSPEYRKVMRSWGLTPSRVQAAWEKRVARASEVG